MSYPASMHPHALVLEDFHAEASTDLTVKKGEHVFLIWTYNDGWFVCDSRGAYGCVPARFLKPDGYGQLTSSVPPIEFPPLEDENDSQKGSDAKTKNENQSNKSSSHSSSSKDNNAEDDVNETKVSDNSDVE
ncbi:hypothetical protein F5Y06DRAFT_299432 [Hypoxylon sp. FL0890]|nr:hypothetical protein F5Y06DRAFT_299432 [Hypoxylon sp. FL0890]